MTTHTTGTREQWLAARLELLEAEKELTHRSDDVARQRQQLPWVPVEKGYLCHRIDLHLVRWARWKHKRLQRSGRRARTWLRGVRLREPALFVHWRYCTPPR